jgi:hypothetical protein
LETYLSDDFLRQLTATGEVDLLVSVPTANNRQTIEHILNAIQVGLVKYFPRERMAILNPDAQSRDGTQEIVKAASTPDFRSFLATAPLRTIRTLTASYHPSRGQAGALQLIMTAADLLRAKACAIISPDVTSITPEWIDALIRPVYREGFGLLTPVYQRHRYEGVLIKNLLSPFVRATYGYRIEEPAPDDLAFSGALACHYAAQDVWHEGFMRDGAAVWMTTTALAGGFRACQSFLGPKVFAAKRMNHDLAGTIQHIVGALFKSLEAHEDFWRGRSEPEEVPLFGFPSELDLGPSRVNRKKLFAMFQHGTGEIASILERILSAPTLHGVLDLAKGDEVQCRYSDELWVKTVYEFAAAYHHRVMNQDHLLQALTPLYRGRVSSFLRENRGADREHLRSQREALQIEYERKKPYLIECWQAKS